MSNTETTSYEDTPFGGVFAKFAPQMWPFRYEAELLFLDIAGGVPSDPAVAEGWIKSKIKDPNKGDRIRQAVDEIMKERNLTQDEATAELNAKRNCNGFLRDPATGQLYIKGYQAKAALKEAVSVAVAAGKLEQRKWGKTNKGAISFAAEHIQVMEERILLGVTEPTEVIQTFPVNSITKQTSIQYTEVCRGVTAKFTVTTDWQFTDEQWAAIWLTGNLQGMGASRSQDHGRYNVIGWELTDW